MLQPKVLIIDDSPMMLRFVSGVLSAQLSPAPEVFTARRAGEGLLRAAESRPDLVLLDYELPDLGGDIFCERLEAAAISTRTPLPAIVAMCSQGAGPRAAQPAPARAGATILKPFTPELLVATLQPFLAEEALKQRRATVPTAAAAAAASDFAVVAATVRARARLVVPTAASTAAAPPAEPDGKTARVTPPGTLDSDSRVAVRSTDSRAAHLARGSSSGGGNSHRVIFRGNTRTLSLRSALRMAGEDRLTGVLRIFPARRAGAQPAEVFIRRGGIALVTTRESSAYAEGATLPVPIESALVTEAVRGQADSGCPFPLLLHLRGSLPEAAARELTHDLGQRFFARLWTLPRLTLEFEAFDELPEFVPGTLSNSPPSAFEADDWLLDTLRRVRAEELPGLDVERFDGTPAYTREGYESVPRLRLTEAETEFAAQVDGRKDLGDIARALGLAPASAFLLLYRFRAIEAMDYWPASLLARPAAAPPAEIVADRAVRRTRKIPTEQPSAAETATRPSATTQPDADPAKAPRLSGPWPKNFFGKGATPRLESND